MVSLSYTGRNQYRQRRKRKWGFTGGYYTGGGNSAGTVMAILLLLAVVLTVLAFIFIVPENRREKLSAFGKFLHDTCKFQLSAD